MPAAQGKLRRSSRLNTYDSNGRDFLAESIGWSRQKLENWITSPTVRPHLQLWYQTCIAGPRRFNDAVEWINSGERGGDASSDDRYGDESSGYVDYKANTTKWITQELWARTAWRIVNANKDEGQAFAKYADKHSAARYGFVIDLLCLAFHSLAFRGAASVYASLINGDLDSTASHDLKNSKSEQVDDESSSTTTYSSFDNEDLDGNWDEDLFDNGPVTPTTSVSREGNDIGVDPMSHEAEDVLEEDAFDAEPMNLSFIDKHGISITGYRTAA